jgi:membrane-bound hydrogenase subunit mbhJ
VFGRHARRHSVWLFPLNSASCNGCDQEIQALHAARYALEEGGIAFAASPRHADILLLTGILTPRNQRAAWRVLEQLAEPRAVIAVGDCPINGSVFRTDRDTAFAGEPFPIDVELPGCPPSPTLILEAIEAAVNLLDGEDESEPPASAEESEAADEGEDTEEKNAETAGDADEEAADEESEEHADTNHRRNKP